MCRTARVAPEGDSTDARLGPRLSTGPTLIPWTLLTGYLKQSYVKRHGPARQGVEIRHLCGFCSPIRAYDFRPVFGGGMRTESQSIAPKKADLLVAAPVSLAEPLQSRAWSCKRQNDALPEDTRARQRCAESSREPRSFDVPLRKRNPTTDEKLTNRQRDATRTPAQIVFVRSIRPASPARFPASGSRCGRR